MTKITAKICEKREIRGKITASAPKSEHGSKTTFCLGLSHLENAESV